MSTIAAISKAVKKVINDAGLFESIKDFLRNCYLEKFLPYSKCGDDHQGFYPVIDCTYTYVQLEVATREMG